MYIKPFNQQHIIATEAFERLNEHYELDVVLKNRENAIHAMSHKIDLAKTQFVYWLDWVNATFNERHPQSIRQADLAGQLDIQQTPPEYRTVLAAVTFATRLADKVSCNRNSLYRHVVTAYALQEGANRHLSNLLKEPDIDAIAIHTETSWVMITDPHSQWVWSLAIPDTDIAIKNGSLRIHPTPDYTTAVATRSLVDAASWSLILTRTSPEKRATVMQCIPGISVYQDAINQFIHTNHFEGGPLP